MSVRSTERLVDQPPAGVVIGRFDTYVEARRVVDHLVENGLPVKGTAIVGSGLRRVERITGPLSWLRTLGSGLAGGAWFGLFVGLLLGLVAESGGAWVAAVLMGLLAGAMLGLISAMVTHLRLRGCRSFRSQTSLVAARYEVYCGTAEADRARTLLASLALRGEIFPLPGPNGVPDADS